VCRMLCLMLRYCAKMYCWGLGLLHEFIKLLSLEEIGTFNIMYLFTANTFEDLCVAYTLQHFL